MNLASLFNDNDGAGRFGSYADIQERLISTVLSIALTIVKTIIAALIIVLLSIFGYIYIRSSLLPIAIINEPVYFDFSKSSPVANIILADRKQWSMLDKYESHRVNAIDNRFLRSGDSYEISMSYSLSQSDKNMQLNKFMSTLTLIDASGEVFALSNRLVSIPYQSLPSRILESVVFFPLRTLGLMQLSESVDVDINFMRNFVESGTSKPATHMIEVKLSTHDVDLVSAWITIMPSLTGINYFFYYYPKLTCAIIVGTATVIQCGLLAIVMMISYLIKLASPQIAPHQGSAIGSAREERTNGETLTEPSADSNNSEEVTAGSESPAMRVASASLLRRRRIRVEEVEVVD